MEDLAELERLSLISQITSELDNHYVENNRGVAEFLISLHQESGSLSAFKKELEEGGAGLNNSLVESLWRLIGTMRPKKNGEKTNGHAASKDMDKRSCVFTGLAIPDREEDWADDPLVGAKAGNAVDDTFAILEGLAPAAGGPPKSSNGRKRSRSPPSRRRSRSPFEKRKSKRHREDSWSGDENLDDFGRKSRGKRDYRNGDKELARRRDYEERDALRRPPTPELDNEPKLYKVYEGHVTGVKDFGAFVNLHHIRGKVDGLVHVSAIQEGARVNHPSDLLSRGQEVKVKVSKIEGNRIGLSMKDVDQETGQDLAPQQRIFASGANSQALPGQRGISDSSVPVVENRGGTRRDRKRMTTPERWEIKQLIASGAARPSDFPELYETAPEEVEFEQEEDVDIEIREEEPPFLAGQTEKSLELSPIRVVKAPEGSLNRAAVSGTTLAKERREMKQAEAAEKAAENSKADLSSQWHDPMAAPDRKFASDVRSAAQASTSALSKPQSSYQQKKSQSFGRRTTLSMKEQRETLPVFKFRDALLEAVRSHQILVVVGETGSGKTTQLTQYLAEGGFANDGMIGCTQPRRVAAMSVAKRVAEEVGCRLGQEVGYTIRFEDCTSPSTKIKYMTDGMLQREVLRDHNLSMYSVIMLDEAHERTIATDVLFGLLKKVVKRRPDLKVIVTSATLDAEKFSEYFYSCPVFTIPGRTFPVEIMYAKEPAEDWLEEALVTVMQIHLAEPPGDILLFLTGQEEIETSKEVLEERMKKLGPNVPELIILPVYSALPSENQSQIFDPAPPGCRKVVIATNIAETSITIDHIYYVIDPGFVKQNAYDPKLGMDSLVVVPISQAQAKQRAGRAGRTGPGKCFRLYTEAAFQSEMLPTSIPDIQRQNLGNTILQLKAIGINDLLHFGFMDPPPTKTMLSALKELYDLSELDDEGLLTRFGRRMADFPVDPELSKSLLASTELECSDEVLTITAMVSATQTVFYRPREKQQQADQKKAKFHDSQGDHLTLLNVYNSWKESGFSTTWCYENFIQARAMGRVKDVRQQLLSIMQQHRQPIISCGRDTKRVRQALVAGLFRKSARKDPQEGYKTLAEDTPVYMHPSSALFGRPAEHVIYHTLVLTTKEYMHWATAIEPKWLVEAAPTFFQIPPPDQLSKRKKAERIQPLHNKYAAEDDWRLSAQKRQGRGGGGGTWG